MGKTLLKPWKVVLLALVSMLTLYLALCYVAAVGWFVGSTLGFWPGVDMPRWLAAMVWEPFLPLLIALAPTYLVWILFAPSLSWKERATFLLALLIMNIFGMLVFLFFMVDRYTGASFRPRPGVVPRMLGPLVALFGVWVMYVTVRSALAFASLTTFLPFWLRISNIVMTVFGTAFSVLFVVIGTRALAYGRFPRAKHDSER